MRNKQVIVIGSSAGGVTALQQLVSELPADFQVPIFIVQHVAAQGHSYLPEILTTTGPLKAKHPLDGELIKPGNIYVAPPEHHMIIEEEHILVRKGPKENRFRPCVDALFRSAAYTYRTGVIGVVLTGMLDDGSSGMWWVQRMGGTTIVQDPSDALYPSMPSSVLQYVETDYILPLAQINSVLTGLTQKMKEDNEFNHHDNVPDVSLLKAEISIAAEENAFNKGILKMGDRSDLTCPDCGGALAKITEGGLIRYRCHTGHGFTSDSLLAEVNQVVEKKLWQTLRGMEEIVMVLEQAADKLAANGNDSAAANYQTKAQNASKSASEMRNFISRQLSINEAFLPQALNDQIRIPT